MPRRNDTAERPRRDRTIARILAILRDAGGGGTLRIADARQRYGVSERTLYRDIRTLRRIGLGIALDGDIRAPRGRNYRLDGRSVLPPARLSLEEALPLALAGRHLFGGRQIPLLESAAGGVARVLDGVSRPVESDLSKLDRRFSVRLAPRNPARGFSDAFRTIVHAMLRGRSLDASYRSAYDLSSAAPQRFRIEPYALAFRHRAWYLLGRRRDRDGVRIYKLVRFRHLIMTESRFELPSGFDVERHFGLAWSVIRGRPRVKVEIDFDPNFAGTIADTEWHPTQTISTRPDGSMRFTCRVDGLDEILWWVLSMGSHAKVVKPAALARRVKTEALATVASYDAPRSSGRSGRVNARPTAAATRRAGRGSTSGRAQS